MRLAAKAAENNVLFEAMTAALDLEALQAEEASAIRALNPLCRDDVLTLETHLDGGMLVNHMVRYGSRDHISAWYAKRTVVAWVTEV